MKSNAFPRSRRPLRCLLVAGARPNFMKVAPLLREFRKHPALFRTRLVHTGQHYDEMMSDVFFQELEMPRPDVHLGVGSASHAVQTAWIMEAFEKVLPREDPDWVVVVGDVNSTLACALVAAKMTPPVRVAHVEAGLRSRDRTMPEEINRILTDAIADLLFTTSADADRNLRSEGVDRRKIHRVGNVMIDTLQRFKRRSDASAVLSRLGISPPYALVTLHRPSNVGEARVLRRILTAFESLAREVTLVFPAHPRTRKMLSVLNPMQLWKQAGNGIHLVEPLGYLDFLHLQKGATLILTDSGGIQEEATILGVPCLTLRENTERPVTVTHGTNYLVGNDPRTILRAARQVLRQGAKKARPIPLWDGRAASRIVRVFARLRSNR